MFSARLLQFFFFPWLIVKTLNVFLRCHLLMYFFPFSFPGLDESFDDNKTGKCCLSVRLVVCPSLCVKSPVSFVCLKRGLSAGRDANASPS